MPSMLTMCQPTALKRSSMFSLNERLAGAGEGDVVLVVEGDQLAEPEVAGQRGRLHRDALHQVAVGAEDVGSVVDDRVVGPVVAGGEVGLGEGEPDGVGEPLAERAGGDLDAGGVAALGVAGRLRAQLAEGLDLLDRQVVAGQVEQRVEQRRAVAGGEDEPVAVGPRPGRSGCGGGARPTDVGEGRRRRGADRDGRS
jgi:hypothetical protein